MSKMKRLQIIICVMIAGVQILSCSPEAAQEEPMQMPFKENTWVRKETITKSMDSIPSTMSGIQIETLPVDNSLAKKLKTISTSNSVTNEMDCLAKASELDQRRTEVQKRGGLWHSFEKIPEAKKYSDYGMQLDSQMNRMVFSLKYLCRAAKGIPLDGWGRKMVTQLEEEGKEKMRQNKIEMGNAPADVDKWIAYAERGIESRNRNIPFSKIGESISLTENLVSFYEDLSVKRIDKDSLNSFYSDSSTLLHVIKDTLKSDTSIALAIEEENLMPSDENGIGNEM